MRFRGITLKTWSASCPYHLGGIGVVDGAAYDVVTQRILSHRRRSEEIAHVARTNSAEEAFHSCAGAAAFGIKAFEGEVEESPVLAVVDSNPDRTTE
jgi:hypothetical protein